jgi:hypothetical protein
VGNAAICGVGGMNGGKRARHGFSCIGRKPVSPSSGPAPACPADEQA